MSAAETTAIDFMTAARKAAGSKLWRQAVKLLRPLAETGHIDAVILLSEVLCAAGKPAEAAEALAPADTGNVVLMKQLGDCYLQAQQWQQALAACKAALDLNTDQQQVQLQATRPAQQQDHQPRQQTEQHCQNKREAGAAARRQPTVPGSVPDCLALQACCAAAMYSQGGAHAEAAVHLVHCMLQQQQQQHGQDMSVALRLYAQIAADRGQWAAAASAAVRLLSKKPQDKEGAQLLALAVQDPSGMQALLSTVLVDTMPLAAAAAGAASQPGEIPTAGPNIAAAFSFLAHTLLTQGAVQQASELYRKAVQHNPRSSRCALGLVQALEVQCDYAGVLQAVLGFCTSDRDVQLGPLSLQTVASLPALQQLSQHPLQLGSLQWYQHAACSEVSKVFCRGEGAVQQQNQQRPKEKAQQQESQVHVVQKEARLKLPQQQQPLHETQQHGAKLDVPSAEATAAPAPLDLQALALLMTAAKVLFCGGALTAAADMLQLLLPAEQATAAGQPLHQSSIRNEAAYAALMRKLFLGDVPPPSVLSAVLHLPKPHKECMAETDVLYVCGDSHILPLAWRPISLFGKQHLMVPLLVTGCKAWHLRPGSTHPCSKHINTALDAVAPGSRILLVLGEIDCREGLLMAIEKMKYETLQEAVAATVVVYVSAVLQLVQQKQLQLWVHCVPPVLPETRHVVHLFNQTLQQQLQLEDALQSGMTSSVSQDQLQSHLAQHGSISEVPRARPSVDYVDLESVLLKNAACLEFDGTHLHPCYVQHLQAAMSCNGTA